MNRSDGLIYFIQHDKDGPVKIGFTSRDVSKRLVALQAGNPYPLYLRFVMRGSVSLENALHHAFAEYRMNGEWFRVDGRVKGLMVYIELESYFDAVNQIEYIAAGGAS